MATHSSVLVWRIPQMGKPGRLPSLGLHRVRHDWSDLAAAAPAAWPSMPWVLIHDFFPLSDSKPKYRSFSFTAYYETFSCTTISEIPFGCKQQ